MRRRKSPTHSRPSPAIKQAEAGVIVGRERGPGESERPTDKMIHPSIREGRMTLRSKFLHDKTALWRARARAGAGGRYDADDDGGGRSRDRTDRGSLPASIPPTLTCLMTDRECGARSLPIPAVAEPNDTISVSTVYDISRLDPCLPWQGAGT